VTAAAPHDRVDSQEGTSPPGDHDGLDADEHTGGHEACAPKGRSRCSHVEPRAHFVRVEKGHVAIPSSTTVAVTVTPRACQGIPE
jgi:hypothetical protein